VEDKFFDQARFFRYVPNFVIQFGLAASPAKTKKWDKQIKDDPVSRTNGVGTLSFATAGPNTRTSQIFINLRSNQTLDSDGFAPFARIVEGMDVIGKIYAGYGELPDQEQITNQGNAYLNAKFPKLDYIVKATII
jgi:cyclophilin family peptidyl-prolyl cis-trans isomerase